MAFGVVTFTEMTAFRKTFDKLIEPEEQKTFYTKVTKQVAARMLAQLIKNTPVGENTYVTNDYGEQELLMQGGTLRRGWLVKTHKEAVIGKDPVAGAAKATAKKAVNRLTVGKKGNEYFVTLKNSVKYASFVNDGHKQEVGRFVAAIQKRLVHRWVEGQHFVEISEVMIIPKIPAILKKSMNDYLNEKLNKANY